MVLRQGTRAHAVVLVAIVISVTVISAIVIVVIAVVVSEVKREDALRVEHRIMSGHTELLTLVKT